mgnify:CR=1 FL=1
MKQIAGLSLKIDFLLSDSINDQLIGKKKLISLITETIKKTEGGVG